jgi:hypothetical protein
MKTFQEMIGPDCGRDIDRQIRAIVGEFHRNVENLCKEEFDYFALADGYVKLKPGQVVVDAKPIIEYCEACDEEGLTVVCDGCVLRPIRDRIKEARDE